MITDLWVIVQIIGDAFVLVFSFYAVWLGVRIARKWNIQSASEEQLWLERKSHLVSTVMNYVFGFQLISLLLFVVTVNDHFPQLIKGAMCGTGSLNANAYGWPTLYLKITGFFVYGLWLMINTLDQKVPEFPLTRLKFYLLLPIIPFVVSQVVIELLYFIHINPNIITTCCSITFSDNPLAETTMSGSRHEMAWVLGFYLLTGILLLLFFLLQTKHNFRIGNYVFSLLTALFFFLALKTLILHFSKYIYGMPSHHCPFDMLWGHYYYVGYLLYLSLFVGTLTGLSVGLMALLSRKEKVREEAQRLRQRFLSLSMANLLFYTLLVSAIKFIWKTI